MVQKKRECVEELPGAASAAAPANGSTQQRERRPPPFGSPFPAPSSRSRWSDSPFPIPHSRFPIPDSRFPIAHSLAPPSTAHLELVSMPLPATIRTLAVVTSLCAAIACREAEGSYQGYADRTAAVGDSALVAVSSYLTVDSTGPVRYDSAAAQQVERLSTQFGGIMRPAMRPAWPIRR